MVESQKLCTNAGAIDTVTLTLPAAAAGLAFDFFVAENQTMEILADSGDTIRIGAEVSSTYRKVSSDVVGARLRLSAIDDTQWVALTADPGSDWAVAA